MNREEQILHQANICFASNQEHAFAFAQGARWADYSPNPKVRVYAIMVQYETENDDLQGLWLFACGYFFRTREQAEQYAQTHPIYSKRKYNILELQTYPTE